MSVSMWVTGKQDKKEKKEEMAEQEIQKRGGTKLRRQHAGEE